MRRSIASGARLSASFLDPTFAWASALVHPRSILTPGKTDTLANKRLAFDRLRNRDNVVKLFNVLGPRFAKRPGGYTRILKMGFRVGDNAPMAVIEFVDRDVEAKGKDSGPLDAPV